MCCSELQCTAVYRRVMQYFDCYSVLHCVVFTQQNPFPPTIFPFWGGACESICTYFFPLKKKTVDSTKLAFTCAHDSLRQSIYHFNRIYFYMYVYFSLQKQQLIQLNSLFTCAHDSLRQSLRLQSNGHDACRVVDALVSLYPRPPLSLILSPSPLPPPPKKQGYEPKLKI